MAGHPGDDGRSSLLYSKKRYYKDHKLFEALGAVDELNACLLREKSPEGPAVIEIISDQWETPVLQPTSVKKKTSLKAVA